MYDVQTAQKIKCYAIGQCFCTVFTDFEVVYIAIHAMFKTVYMHKLDCIHYTGI